MRLRTRVFDLAKDAGWSGAALADAMGMSEATVSLVRSNKREIGQRFIAGALRAFPSLSFDDLFWYERSPEQVTA